MSDLLVWLNIPNKGLCNYRTVVLLEKCQSFLVVVPNFLLVSKTDGYAVARIT